MQIKNIEEWEGLSQGERRLVEWQFGLSGSFVTQLFMLIARADSGNRIRLSLAFPDEVIAYQRFAGEDAYWTGLCERLGIEEAVA